MVPGLERSAGEGIGYLLQYSWASLVAQLVKNCLQCRRPGFLPSVGKTPCRREGLPSPVFGPREFHGLYSPWGRKELEMIEQLSLSLHVHFLIGKGKRHCTSTYWVESILEKMNGRSEE